MVVARGERCQRDRGRGAGRRRREGGAVGCQPPPLRRPSVAWFPCPPRQKQDPGHGGRGPARGSDVQETKGNKRVRGVRGSKGGAAGGLSRRPCGHCINEGGVWGWSLSRVLWALCRRSPWRPPVASGGSKPPAGDTVRTGGGRSCTVRVHCGGQPVLPYRFGRPGRRLGPAAVAANSLPVPFSARGNRRGARSGGGTGRHTSTVSAKVSRSSPAARNVPGRTWGLPSGALSLSCSAPSFLRCAGGEGEDRRDRRVAAVRAGGSARACTLRRAALSCADRELAQAVPNIEILFFQYVNVS